MRWVKQSNKWGLLAVLSLVLWLVAYGYYKNALNKRQVPQLLSLVQKDIREQQLAVEGLVTNHSLMNRIWTQQITEKDLTFLAKQKYIIHLYIDGNLQFWNSNAFPISESRFFSKWQCLREQNNCFLYRSIGNEKFPRRRINIIIPIFNHFDISNYYLNSSFSASDIIPPASKISASQKEAFHPIRSFDGQVLFFLNIDIDQIAPYVPDFPLIVIVLTFFFISVLALQLLSIQLSRRYSSIAGVLVVFFTLLIAHFLMFQYGLPFGLGNLDVFSPVIFASNNITPSFGHLFLHIISIYWFFSLILSQIAKKSTNNFFDESLLKRGILLVLEVFFCIGFVFYLQYLMRSLVYDSDISFDTNNFNATDKFTFFALIIIAVIARVFYLKIELARAILSKILMLTPKNKLLILSLIVGFYLLIGNLIGILEHNPFGSWLDWVAIFWGVLFLFGIGGQRDKKQLPNDGLFAMIFVSVYFSVFFGYYFKNYIDEKEQKMLRVSFAEKLSRQQDSELEINFKNYAPVLSQDSILRSWLLDIDALTETDLLKYLRVRNADLFYNNYDPSIYLFNDHQKSVLNNKSLSLDSLKLLRGNSIPTISDWLLFRLDNKQQGAYLGIIPIKDTNGKDDLGTLVIDFVSKHNLVRSVYPKLISSQKETKRGAGSFEYDYATYYQGNLLTRSGEFEFADRIQDDLKIGEKRFQQKGRFSLLYYKAYANKTYVVVYENNKLLGVLTIFSFLFGAFLLISSFEKWLSQLSVSWALGVKKLSFYHSSMSLRIKYFVLGFTGVSFLIIGIATILFLNKKNVDSSTESIKQQSSNLAEAIQDYIHNQNGSFRLITNHANFFENKDFVFFLTNIAQQQKLDLNLFDPRGKLMFSSHDNLYQANVLSRNMSFTARYNLEKKRLGSFLQPETIGSLKFKASYTSLYDAHNNFIGYLHIPFFFTNEELQGQIMSLITTLVNIYTILILISSFITFLFVNNLTKSLNLVAEKLRNVNLKKNELIVWPYKDEIGLLVEEYNKMVETVEKNARSLVLDERQNAWREMAQQVAHEIKNPLTPMKLNIQYLQQAINSNHPDIINLTKRVSSSIIEQIDNLNYIASEFSNFAKMPENKTDRIDLKLMLENIVLLFGGNKNIKITHTLPQEPAVVYADKSQMLRIFTNIVQNAVEAMPDEKTNGVIHIELIPDEDKQQITIKVSDNGSGIPDEVKDKIFDPYFTTKSSGTGLGLAMSKKIIELWGGSIRFESEQDTGTIFYLQLPMG